MKCQPFAVSRLTSYLMAGIFSLGLASQALAQGGPPAGQGQPANNNPIFADRGLHNGEEGLRKVELIAATDAENKRAWRLQWRM